MYWRTTCEFKVVFCFLGAAWRLAIKGPCRNINGHGLAMSKMQAGLGHLAIAQYICI